jgi:hypothetical protein
LHFLYQEENISGIDVSLNSLKISGLNRESSIAHDAGRDELPFRKINLENVHKYCLLSMAGRLPSWCFSKPMRR